MLLEMTFQSGDVYTPAMWSTPASRAPYDGVVQRRFVSCGPQKTNGRATSGSRFLPWEDGEGVPAHIHPIHPFLRHNQFSEDRAPLVCEHNDLLVPDDILFPGIRKVTTHCGSLHMDPILKAGLHLNLWVMKMGG